MEGPGGTSPILRLPLAVLVAALLGACGGSEVNSTAIPRPSTTAGRGPDRVAVAPERVTVGSTVHFRGSGFTDPMWRSGDSLWLVNSDDASCGLVAAVEQPRVTLTAGGLLEGEFAVPASGSCGQSDRRFELAPGTYGIVYACASCQIGELTVFEAALTPRSRLRAEGIGPILIGMTLDEVRRAAGTPLRTETLPGCVELVPTDPGLRVGLWSHDGNTIDMISVPTASFATTGGIRTGSTVDAVEQAYPTFTRNVDGGTYLVVGGRDGSALVFEALGNQVATMFAGQRERIEYGGHCP